MRGKRHQYLFYCLHYRITPADAGKTDEDHAAAFVWKDHPRGCGENALGASAACRCAGSPPRMRGKLPPLVNIGSTFRITPADAGKTHVDGGENLYRYKSPPRMRGKPKVCIYMRRRERITPADAGKTEQIPDKRLLRKDHPRGCGENSSIKSSLRFSLGSPPRMRGKHYFRQEDAMQGRITPADAGKTCKRGAFERR